MAVTEKPVEFFGKYVQRKTLSSWLMSFTRWAILKHFLQKKKNNHLLCDEIKSVSWFLTHVYRRMKKVISTCATFGMWLKKKIYKKQNVKNALFLYSCKHYYFWIVIDVFDIAYTSKHACVTICGPENLNFVNYYFFFPCIPT